MTRPSDRSHSDSSVRVMVSGNVFHDIRTLSTLKIYVKSLGHKITVAGRIPIDSCRNSKLTRILTLS